jgi:hypothetical protein
MNRPDAFPDDQMTSTERIAEIASILALGLMRLRARKSSALSCRSGESSLDFTPGKSGREQHVLTSEGRS